MIIISGTARRSLCSPKASVEAFVLRLLTKNTEAFRGRCEKSTVPRWMEGNNDDKKKNNAGGAAFVLPVIHVLMYGGESSSGGALIHLMQRHGGTTAAF